MHPFLRTPQALHEQHAVCTIKPGICPNTCQRDEQSSAATATDGYGHGRAFEQCHAAIAADFRTAAARDFVAPCNCMRPGLSWPYWLIRSRRWRKAPVSATLLFGQMPGCCFPGRTRVLILPVIKSPSMPSQQAVVCSSRSALNPASVRIEKLGATAVHAALGVGFWSFLILFF
jgi:hypothetical protein